MYTFEEFIARFPELQKLSDAELAEKVLKASHPSPIINPSNVKQPLKPAVDGPGPTSRPTRPKFIQDTGVKPAKKGIPSEDKPSHGERQLGKLVMALEDAYSSHFVVPNSVAEMLKDGKQYMRMGKANDDPQVVRLCQVIQLRLALAKTVKGEDVGKALGRREA